MNKITKEIDSTRLQLSKTLEQSGLHPAILLLVLKDVYNELTAINSTMEDEEETNDEQPTND